MSSSLKPFRLLWNLWLSFSHILGLIMSTIILTILWIVGFGLYAIVLKIVTLPQRFRKPPMTFWIDVEPEPVEHMKYPF